VVAKTLIAVVRISGKPDRTPDERKSLELLRLHKRFHAVLVKDTPSIRGMLKKVEYAVTYGEIDEDTLAQLIERRGRLTGNKKVTQEYLKKIGFDDFKSLARALIEGKVDIRNLPDFKPVFRLSPPSKEFKENVKKHDREGGEQGYRGEAINELLRRMI